MQSEDNQPVHARSAHVFVRSENNPSPEDGNAGLVIVESLVCPGWRSRASLAKEDILGWWFRWWWRPLWWDSFFPDQLLRLPAPLPRFMAVPETLSKWLEWSLSGLWRADSEKKPTYTMLVCWQVTSFETFPSSSGDSSRFFLFHR